MTCKDAMCWLRQKQVNTSPYGAAVIAYTGRWADMMEAEIATGAKLKDIAKRTSHDADTDHITGFMYGAAVSILSRCWVHGERLRRWHNSDTQLSIEGDRANESGGVLNPAILTVKG